MELKRGLTESGVVWKIRGSLDDESSLTFENTVLNSEYKGEDMVLDLTGASSISLEGQRALDRVLRGAMNKGASVRVIGTDPNHLELG